MVLIFLTLNIYNLDVYIIIIIKENKSPSFLINKHIFLYWKKQQKKRETRSGKWKWKWKWK